MSQKPETVFRQKFRKRLNALPNCWWESIQQKAISGTPDIIGCVNGYFVGLELKAHERAPATKLQLYKLRLIGQAGGMGVIVHPGNMEEVLALLRHMATEEDNDQIIVGTAERVGAGERAHQPEQQPEARGQDGLSGGEDLHSGAEGNDEGEGD